MAGNLFRCLNLAVKFPDLDCLFVTGEVGSGKTTVCKNTLSLSDKEISIGGILSPRLLQNGETVGYTVVDLASGEEKEFASLNPPGISAGKFYITKEGLKFARKAVSKTLNNKQIVFIDEVGWLEVNGKGLYGSVQSSLKSQSFPVILTRPDLLPWCLREFKINKSIQMFIPEPSPV